MRLLLRLGGDSAETWNWLGGKYQTMTPEERGEFRQALDKRERFDKEHMPALAAGVRDATLREDFMRNVAGWLSEGDAEEAVALLETLPDPSRRFRVLLDGTPHPHGSLYGENEELLRRKLAEWKIPQAQVEEVLSKFKPLE